MISLFYFGHQPPKVIEEMKEVDGKKVSVKTTVEFDINKQPESTLKPYHFMV